jgi:photosystem II stability/assembly factor-like uncharacterized protein
VKEQFANHRFPGTDSRFLAAEGEGMTWMRQPSRQGIALFSVRMDFGEAQV